MSTLGWIVGTAVVVGGSLSVGYALSSAAELSQEGRFWHKRLRGPDDDEEDTFDPDDPELDDPDFDDGEEEE